jgi:glycosyltransferase involved in cell wall biosynthesis
MKLNKNGFPKILIIIDALNLGGAEQITVQTANLLSQKNYDVLLCTILTWKDTPLAAKIHSSVKKASINRTNKWSLHRMRILSKYIKQYDVVHVHSYHNFRYVQLVNVLFGVFKNIIYHEHSGDAIKNRLPNFLKRIIFHNVIYLANNTKLLNHIRRDWELLLDKTVYLPNPVRTPIITINKPKIAFTIGMIGNFLTVKNYEFAIKLFNNLNLKNSQLLIVGHIYDRQYFDRIQKLVNESKLPIRLITDCNNSYDVIPEFDFAWHTSYSESGPLVLGEYMAFEKPFICFETGEVANTVKNSLPELVMDNYDEPSWVKACNTIIEDLEGYGKKLHYLYLNYYTEDKYLNKCIEAYQKSLSY